MSFAQDCYPLCGEGDFISYEQFISKMIHFLCLVHEHEVQVESFNLR